MKVIPAVHVVEQAMLGTHKRAPGMPSNYYRIREGEKVESIWETTSGTAGLALAYACRWAGVPLGLVSDPVIEPPLQAELKSLDVEVHLVDPEAAKAQSGVQNARLTLLHDILKTRRGAYWAKQYDNTEWRLSYYHVAAQIIAEVGKVDVLVCGTGSCASSTGLFEGTRMACPNVQLVGVDTIGSILFDAPPLPRRLRGVGMGLIPGNLVRKYFTWIHWVSAPFAWTHAYLLHREHTVPVGPTTGAAFAVAKLIADTFPGRRVVFLGPDDSKRYEPKVFSPELMQRDELWLPELPDEPRITDDPRDVCYSEHWWATEWGQKL